MNGLFISILSIVYLGFLFFLAFIAEKFKKKNKSLINNPVVFALSLSVYCTAWTFYGSVGRVNSTGIEFLSIYIGPTLVMIMGWTVMRKIIRIAHVHRINSISDFISARYGKYRSLGFWVTFISLLACIPYIGLQIKAISKSFETLTGVASGQYFFQDSAFYIVIILIVFTLLFGTRKIQSNETHEGMIFAISVEAVLKLVAFLVVGVFVTFWVNDGFADVFEKRLLSTNIREAFTFEKSSGYGNWFIHIIISGFAFLFLPRQFQVAVVENHNEKNLQQSLWLFPLYLFVINIFVIPIAITGNSFFAGTQVIADNYVIALPLLLNAKAIALIAYLGGFSAATGMIIVETIAISTMMTNSVILPFLLESRKFKEKFTFKILNLAIWLRRFSIVLIVLLGYGYYSIISNLFSLVSIGLVAFVAISQFAPILLGGIFWKNGTQKGALVGLISGIVIWFFALILPPFLDFSTSKFWLAFYEAFAPFKIQSFDEISNTSFWSLLLNSILYWIVSLFSSQSAVEAKQAMLFVDVFNYSDHQGQSVVWKGKARNAHLFNLLASFIGGEKSKELLHEFSIKNNIDLKQNESDPRVVNLVENILGGIIGTSTARILVSTIANEEIISVDEMVEILKRSQKIIEDNEELKIKTEQLQALSVELKNANESLLQIDTIKNDFLTTVTHEIRTPLTSIKALSEIIYDNDDLDDEQRKTFLNTIIHETDRLSRLVNQVLDLEKYESGKHSLNYQDIYIDELVGKLSRRIGGLATDKGIFPTFSLQRPSMIYRGDEDKIMQMLINLMSNAIKFVNSKTGIVDLTISLKGGMINFIVSDNGIGIAPEMQQRLFEKFFQADNQDFAAQKGTGLGLSITKKIVEIHNGNITITSEPNKGSVFSVSLPLNNKRL
jgi:Na+/proline symporter/signal transduction histidine kinase